MTAKILQIAQNSEATVANTSINLTFPNNLAANGTSWIYVVGFQSNTGTTYMTCQDTLNGSYGSNINIFLVSGECTIAQWAILNTSGGGQKPLINVTYWTNNTYSVPASTVYTAIFAAEISGVTGLDTGGTYYSSNVQSNPSVAPGAITTGLLVPKVPDGLCIAVAGELDLIKWSRAANGFTDLYPPGPNGNQTTFWRFTDSVNHGDAIYQVYNGQMANILPAFTSSGTPTNPGYWVSIAALFAAAPTAPKLYANGAIKSNIIIETGAQGNILSKIYANGTIQFNSITEQSGTPIKLYANGNTFSNLFTEI